VRGRRFPRSTSGAIGTTIVVEEPPVSMTSTGRPPSASLAAALIAIPLIVACSSGRPSLGAVRISRVTRTNDTFVADGEVTYEASSASDLVKEITCIVFPAGALPEGATVRDTATTLSGKETFPVPKQPDGITNGRLDFALDGEGKEGKYEVLCGATSEASAVSVGDVRTPIVVP